MTFWVGFAAGVASTLAGMALFLLALLFSRDDGPNIPR